VTTDIPIAVLFPGKKVRILRRRPNPWASTFPSEVLTCEIETLGTVEILCKCSGGREHGSLGHRSGVAYEARVYSDVLAPLSISQPIFYGAARVDADTWLFLEYLGEQASVDEAPSPAEGLQQAARWIGTFHATNESRAGSLTALVRYDARYYEQWPYRTSAMAGDWHRRLPWLRPLCEHAGELATALLSQPVTVLHGEFAPSNVLLREGVVCPVDWESAAIGPGEVDLAALIENWPLEVSDICVREYQTARWPLDPPADFVTRLDLAWLYWHFRWLGERPDWLSERHVLDRANHLRQIGERLGWL
jgi:hypothetical protein